ncbi:alpha-amylase family glycosyl hydrolase [Cryomorphaceae bacterium 1068]|nr:alpha-amylase family glycosyl hydrolase [Cryomorphaceae bacterium 1068]
MKSFVSALCLLFITAFSFAQVTITPEFPSLDEPITIAYNAAEGNGELSGVSPIYMHSGVIISGNPNWQNVQGEWGTADPNVAMTQTGPNTWTKTLTISDFYGVAPTEDVLQLAFVFRNTDGTLVGRTQSGDDIFVNVAEGLPEIMDPPAGVTDGINYISDTSVILQLVAPFKDYVYVIGDFNDWERQPEYFCKKTSSGDRWWVQVDGLTPGEEYRFQYSIDDEDLRVADVYAKKILDPFNDQFIGDNRYPDLIDYPQGETTNIVSVLQTNQEQYEWQDDNFQRPPLDRLIIYELLVRDFTEEGTFQAVIDTLDYLDRLGVNAIELMPVNEFEGNESWGYNSSFFFAVDKYYGTEEDLKMLIDACHDRDIAVIIDVVLNHSFGQNPQVRMYSENGAAGPPTVENPWFNTLARHPFSVGYDYNHDSPYTQEFVKRVLQYWIEEFHIDGYRFDLSKGFTQNNTLGDVGAWNGYDQSRVDNWVRIRNDIHEVDDQVYLILEHLGDNPEETALANIGFMLWGSQHAPFKQAALGFPFGQDLSFASYQNRGWNFPNLVSYAESHDEERLMYENLENGNSFNPDHDPKDLETALARQEAIHAFNIPLLGPKMFWQFAELGYDFSINYCNDELNDPSCRTNNKPVRWDYYFEPARQRLYKVFAAINKLKTDYPAFGSSNFNYDVGGTGKRLIIQHESMDVVIIGNFDVVPVSIIPGFTQTGVWYDYFGGNAIFENNLSNSFKLQPGEYRIYTTVQLPTPDLSVNAVNVTLRVDMSQENINAVTDTVSVSGTFNDFEKLVLDSIGNGIYQTTITLIEGEPIEYKFRVNSGFENPVGLCAAGNFGNRVYTASSSDAVLDAVCYSSCTACPDPNNVNDLTFRVDASELTSIDPDGLHIAGSFNGFTPEPMNNDGNGVYSFTISEVQGASLLWKFLNGDSFAGEEDVPSACGLPDGFGGNNRVLIMPGEETLLDAVCFGSCEVCEGSTTCENPFPAVNPSSISTTDNPQTVEIEWAPLPLQIGCQIQVRNEGSASILGSRIIGGANASSFNIPKSVLGTGSFEWRVRCGCSQTPLIAGPFSAWQPFAIGSGIVLNSNPNPTQGHSDVTFAIENGGSATLEVYDLNGRVVETLFNQEAQPDLSYRIHFDGSALPNGIYLYRLTTDVAVEMEKFVIGR